MTLRLKSKIPILLTVLGALLFSCGYSQAKQQSAPVFDLGGAPPREQGKFQLGKPVTLADELWQGPSIVIHKPGHSLDGLIISDYFKLMPIGAKIKIIAAPILSHTFLKMRGVPVSDMISVITNIPIRTESGVPGSLFAEFPLRADSYKHIFCMTYDFEDHTLFVATRMGGDKVTVSFFPVVENKPMAGAGSLFLMKPDL